jgi:hypothetical protein
MKLRADAKLGAAMDAREAKAKELASGEYGHALLKHVAAFAAPSLPSPGFERSSARVFPPPHLRVVFFNKAAGVL